MKSNSLEVVRSSWVERHRPESESADWGQSLAMYGLLRSLDVSKDEATYQFLKRWVYFHLNESVNVNYFCGSWSFGLLYPEIEKQFPEVQMQLRSTAEEIYDFIMHKALRNGDGVILHNVDLPNIYIDTVYYSSVILAKLGTYLKRDWKNEAIVQLLQHLTILKDGDKPFFIHCEQNLGGKRSEGSWARGNGWVMMTCAELLPRLKPTSKEFELISNEIFLPLASALEKLQTTSGLWRTILDDKTAYEETSASAMYLFALLRGRKIGVLPKRFDETIKKAEKGLSKFVDAKGRFMGVSEGTWPGTIKYYKSLQRGEWWWGTGAYLLALSELKA
jgi:unsaturated rhamnogalacturonyl hydrolase